MHQCSLFHPDTINLTAAQVTEFVQLGLLRAVRRTADGRITEYELTHAGRVFLGAKP